MKHSLIILCLMFLLSCRESSDLSIETPLTNQANILLIIADDMGLDACPGYGTGSTKPNMPNLENMIATGIRFNNVWSCPTCTPTRSNILTGKYGFRTDVTKVDDELSASETSIQEYIDQNSDSEYSQSVIGKWHLSRDASHPANMGIDYYAGLLQGSVRSYWSWSLTENNETNTSTEYTTSKLTDMAIDWVASQTQPWFLWLAYNAPHSPFHLPSNELHSQGTLPNDQASIDANPLPYYMAMLEAMDTEIGRLLSSMSQEEKDNTIIIFIGDNGSPSQVAQEYNSHRVKGTVYQGGINVPMIISGKNVNRFNQTEDALINTTDLFASLADIAGAGTSKINDSQSFKGLFADANAGTRDYNYSEHGYSSGSSDYTIRNSTHKYIRFADGSEALYNLSLNPMESPNLLHSNQLPLSASDALIKEELITKLEEIRQ